MILKEEIAKERHMTVADITRAPNPRRPIGQLLPIPDAGPGRQEALERLAE